MADEHNAPATAPAEPTVPQLLNAEPEAPVAAEVNKPAEASTSSAPSEPAKLTSKEISDKHADAAPAERASEKPVTQADVEMKDAAQPEPAGENAAKPAQPEEEAPDATAELQAYNLTPVPSDKSKARRKSAAAAEPKGKKLNKKQSKARILHLDAKPGDHYFVKLKGYPPWPAVICDEEMLPGKLVNSRPVTAARPDGTYRDDYAEGGKRMADRTFPVMYLHTNEFGWVPNSDLHDLDPDKVLDVKMDKMRKDLQAAHELAAQNHPLDYYKGVLRQFQDDLVEKELAKAAKASAAATSKKAKKVKVDDDEDVEMADAAAEEDADEEEKKSKKRKAEEDANAPQRSDSVKKPKIKFTSSATSKTANGAPAPKSKTPTEAKAAKPKPKKSSKDAEAKAEKEAAAEEPKLTEEDRQARKAREVLFLRHKLQKGLLNRDQAPKAEEMSLMSDFVTKLESFADLEVSIIRLTKINKVLKGILKLDSIPREDEFNFKARSQVLLDKWNKILAVDLGPGHAGTSEGGANGVNGTGNGESSAPKEGKDKVTNGIAEKEDAEAEKSEVANKGKTVVAPAPAEEKEKEAAVVEEAPKAPEAVEASA